MLHYRFKALNAEGVMLDGRIAAQSEREAARLLERRGLSLVDISEEGAGSPAAVSGFAFLRGRERKLRHQDIILALHELSTLLASGVGLAESVAAQARAEAGTRDALEQAALDEAAVRAATHELFPDARPARPPKKQKRFRR